MKPVHRERSNIIIMQDVATNVFDLVNLVSCGVAFDY